MSSVSQKIFLIFFLKITLWKQLSGNTSANSPYCQTLRPSCKLQYNVVQRLISNHIRYSAGQHSGCTFWDFWFYDQLTFELFYISQDFATFVFEIAFKDIFETCICYTLQKIYKYIMVCVWYICICKVWHINCYCSLKDGKNRFTVTGMEWTQ